LSALLQMQGCCPRRDSPSSPRKFAAGILGTKSFQEMVCAFGIGTAAVPANCSFAIATVLRKNSIEQGCSPTRKSNKGQPDDSQFRRCSLAWGLSPTCGRYFEASRVIMRPSHDIGVQGRDLCSDGRSTRGCSRRAASRYLVGSSPRLTHGTAHRTIACGVFCPSPKRISCGVS
jgi:hypothetical protein